MILITSWIWTCKQIVILFQEFIRKHLRHDGFGFEDKPLNGWFRTVSDSQGRSDVVAVRKLRTIWNVGGKLKSKQWIYYEELNVFGLFLLT